MLLLVILAQASVGNKDAIKSSACALQNVNSESRNVCTFPVTNKILVVTQNKRKTLKKINILIFLQN